MIWWILGFGLLLGAVWFVAVRMFPHTITKKEGLVMLGMQSAVMTVVIFGSLYGQGSDTQILNGQVTGKTREVVSCEHSYSCNCVTSCSGGSKNRTCSTICQTCYEHSHDIDWDVQSTVGGTSINRIDRQGTSEPPRWTSIKVGEPFARESNYYNYIKASPFSIFNKSQLDSEVAVPSYLSVYDYYRINRVIEFGVTNKDSQLLNNLLNDTLRTVGPLKKVNVVVVLHNKGNLFSESLRAKQLGGKINDVYVVIDMDKEGVFNSVAVFSWSKTDMVNIFIRDLLLDIGKFDAVAINNVVKEGLTKHYEHRSIEEFKYLDDEVEIPKVAIWFLMIFGLVFPFVGAYIAHKHDIA